MTQNIILPANGSNPPIIASDAGKTLPDGGGVGVDVGKIGDVK